MIPVSMSRFLRALGPSLLAVWGLSACGHGGHDAHQASHDEGQAASHDDGHDHDGQSHADAVSEVVNEVAAAVDGAATEAAEQYKSGLQTLETEYDLSSLNAASTETAAAGHSADDGHGHDHGADGHAHGDELASADTSPGSGLLPAATRYLGGISLAEGESKAYDFGMIREGEAREKIFHFVSDGKEPLVIKAVKPSCGCTRADVSIVQDDGSLTEYERGSEIAVGAKFQLLTEVSTEGKHGAFGTSVSLYTNAPGGSFNLKLEAEVEPVIEVLPEPSLFFGQLTTADTVDETLTVQSRRGEVFHLFAKEETLPAEVAVELTPVEPDAEGRAAKWQARVTAGPGLPVGVRNYPCALETDLVVPNPKYPNPDGSPKHYTIPISIQARVTGMVHATPAFIGFGLVRPGQEVERAVRLECFDDFKMTADVPVTIGGLYGGEFQYQDYFTTSAEVQEDGKFLELKVKLVGLPEDATGSFGGILDIGVGHPSMETVKVRFSGVCRAGLNGRAGN